MCEIENNLEKGKDYKRSAVFNLHATGSELCHFAAAIALTSTESLTHEEWEKVKKLSQTLEESVSMMRRTISDEMDECLQARFKEEA